MYVYYAPLKRNSHLIAVPPDTAGDDCPVFDGLFDYCAISAGGSMGKRHPRRLTNRLLILNANRGGG